MDKDVFGRFLVRLRRQLAKCSRQQVAITHDMVASHAARSLCLQAIEAFGRLRTVCPHCPGKRFHRHGFAAGLQRYRCLDCGRTFNALTHTPLAFLRRRERWLPYLQCMLDSRTVRAAATHAGIHRNTGFRWRHRFLMRTKHDRPGILRGIVEADETYLLESQKGSRHLNRPARRRGGVAGRRGINQEHVCILVARDRGGATRDWVTGRGPVTHALLHICLPPVLARDVILVSDGARAYRTFTAAEGLAHEALNVRAGIRARGPFHIQNVNNYHSRFKGWLARFLGVASHYLPNYLGWRHALDGNRITAPLDLLKAALGAKCC
jgi:transposase-like protein